MWKKELQSAALYPSIACELILAIQEVGKNNSLKVENKFCTQMKQYYVDRNMLIPSQWLVLLAYVDILLNLIILKTLSSLRKDHHYTYYINCCQNTKKNVDSIVYDNVHKNYFLMLLIVLYKNSLLDFTQNV